MEIAEQTTQSWLDLIEKTDPSRVENLLEKVCRRILNESYNESDWNFCKPFIKSQNVDLKPTSLPVDVIADIDPVTKYVLLALYVIVMSLSLFGNSLVFLTFLFNRHMRSVVNIFIVSLAFSDFFVTVTCMPVNLGGILTKYWIFGAISCKIVPFIDNLTVASSSLTLCCIAFDRYYAIVHPLKANAVKSPRRAGLLLVIVWVISLCSSIPYSFCFHLYEVCLNPHGCPKNSSRTYTTAHFCKGYNTIRTEQLQIWLTLVILFIIPFVFMTVTYSVICYTLWSKRPIGTSVLHNEDIQTRYKKKAIKMLILVVILFVGCWAPLIIYEVIAKQRNILASDKSLTLRYYLQWLALSGACVNPIVFAFMNGRFRKNFRTILCCKRNQVVPVAVGNTHPIVLTTDNYPKQKHPSVSWSKEEPIISSSKV